MTSEKKKCFVIMPITTPDTYKDTDHFEHVFNYLIKPTLESLDYDVIPPGAKGSVLIQKEIIKNLEEAELVLCDMSILNPNVFFELGLRTALNKPVCLIKDDKTEEVPFDTNMIYFHTYDSKIELWIIEKELEKLKKHIQDSVKNSGKDNTLWRYLGITNIASKYDQEPGPEGKLDFIITQLESLNRNVDKKEYGRDYPLVGDNAKRIIEQFFDKLSELCGNIGGIAIGHSTDGVLNISIAKGKLTLPEKHELYKFSRHLGVSLVLDEY